MLFWALPKQVWVKHCIRYSQSNKAMTCWVEVKTQLANAGKIIVAWVNCCFSSE